MELSQLEKTRPNIFNRNWLRDKRKLLLIILSVFLGFFSILFIGTVHSVLGSSSVYKGVRIQGMDIGGYTRAELKSYLEERNSDMLENITLTLHCAEFEWNYSISELGVRVDIDTMVQKAYDLGRTGSLIERLSNIIKLRNHPVSIDLVIDYETDGFRSFLDKASETVYQEVVPPNIVIMEDSVVLCTGIPGREVDIGLFRAAIAASVQKLQNSTVTVPISEKLPPQIDVDSALKTLNQDPVNAEFVKTSRTTYEIKPHKMGRSITRDKLMEVISYVENRTNAEYEEIPLPVEFIAPELTEADLKAQLFRDTLAAYTTQFRTDTENNQNRSINIGLAAESIDGTLLLPGEEFSFNKVVGPRTTQKGYRTAHIFVDGQVRDGTGGGVCQVSTTLYNAVLKANLQVIERRNHMFTVGYVPLGQDAAVSYGYADLVFKNTTAYPLRINATVSSGNSLTFKIQSTNDYPELEVKLASKKISTTPLTVQYIDDNTLPLGTVIIDENGADGYVVDTYIKVYNGNVLLREEKLHRSVYQMLPRKIIRGTAPVSEMIE